MERRTDLGIIHTKVNGIVAASPIARQVADVKLMSDVDGDGDEFIRVEISLKSESRAYGNELRNLKREIWDAVDEMDGRFASVRFPDAA